MMFGLKFFSKASDGSLTIVSRHPRNSKTWHWAISITRKGVARSSRAVNRVHQWHDFYRLPFGRTLIYSAQDFHKAAPNAR